MVHFVDHRVSAFHLKRIRSVILLGFAAQTITVAAVTVSMKGSLFDMKIPGLIVSPLTPFCDDLTIDDNALRHQIDYIVTDCNAAMESAAGAGTSEYHYLTHDPRRAPTSR